MAAICEGGSPFSVVLRFARWGSAEFAGGAGHRREQGTERASWGGHRGGTEGRGYRGVVRKRGGLRGVVKREGAPSAGPRRGGQESHRGVVKKGSGAAEGASPRGPVQGVVKKRGEELGRSAESGALQPSGARPAHLARRKRRDSRRTSSRAARYSWASGAAAGYPWIGSRHGARGGSSRES